ncbi:hypothetical protein ACROYT_G029693 [Oculina patagonica]
MSKMKRKGACFLFGILELVFVTTVSAAYNTSLWHRFWWWTPAKQWPTGAKDVLKNAYGTCKSSDSYCFQRLPSWVKEDSTELLAIDSEGTVYQWKFDSKNPTAHAVWQAFHDHQETSRGQIVNNKAWDPMTLEGKKPNGHNTKFSKSKVFGVDKLFDADCRGPSPTYGLSLYFRTAKTLTLKNFGGGWRAFWWWEKDSTWPGHVKDILESPYGTCKESDIYCFQRLPSWLKEKDTELLAVDSLGTVYKWAFNPKNPVAHAAWLAFHDHRKAKYKAVPTSTPWNPIALKGTVSSKAQDSFMYREQNGVKSLLTTSVTVTQHLTLAMVCASPVIQRAIANLTSSVLMPCMTTDVTVLFQLLGSHSIIALDVQT